MDTDLCFSSLLAAVLDEVDYGMLLVSDVGQVLHVNRIARAELGARHPIQLAHGRLLLSRLEDQAALRQALKDARRGLRCLLEIGEDKNHVSVAVVPLPATLEGETATLLMLGKQRVCGELSVHWFARAHALTRAESRVLEALCCGRSPSQIAACQGVAMSTVRTQIGSIRAKTGAENIRALVRLVSVLPPLVSALRPASAPPARMDAPAMALCA
jgi:DNA-binding CsgD family transcriptional regulator